jgi:translation elongation factor EF-Tu-like GTPase
MEPKLVNKIQIPGGYDTDQLETRQVSGLSKHAEHAKHAQHARHARHINLAKHANYIRNQER